MFNAVDTFHSTVVEAKPRMVERHLLGCRGNIAVLAYDDATKCQQDLQNWSILQHTVYVACRNMRLESAARSNSRIFRSSYLLWWKKLTLSVDACRLVDIIGVLVDILIFSFLSVLRPRGYLPVTPNKSGENISLRKHEDPNRNNRKRYNRQQNLLWGAEAT